MLELVHRITTGVASRTLTLPLELRARGRLRATLDDGTEVGLFLDRGPILRGGDLIASAEGEIVRIKAASEKVSTIYCEDRLAQCRVSYHLGNRHVALQIAPGYVRYQHDHVLDDMVRGLGLEVTVEEQPFEPEPGAYGGGHGHSHDDHDH